MEWTQAEKTIAKIFAVSVAVITVFNIIIELSRMGGSL